jgi:hypothetical protein
VNQCCLDFDYEPAAAIGQEGEPRANDSGLTRGDAELAEFAIDNFDQPCRLPALPLDRDWSALHSRAAIKPGYDGDASR